MKQNNKKVNNNLKTKSVVVKFFQNFKFIIFMSNILSQDYALLHYVWRDCGNHCISSQCAGGLSLCALIWGHLGHRAFIWSYAAETRPSLPLLSLRPSLCGTLLELHSLLDHQMANQAYGHCVCERDRLATLNFLKAHLNSLSLFIARITLYFKNTNSSVCKLGNSYSKSNLFNTKWSTITKIKRFNAICVL